MVPVRSTVRLAGFVLTLATVGLTATPACANTVTRAAMVTALSGFEHEPPVEEVRAWGPEAVAQLMEIAADPTVLAHARVRAVHALRVFTTAVPARVFLTDVAARETYGLFLRRAAMDALVEGFGAVTEVSRYLTDPHADIRDGAAWALSLGLRPGVPVTVSTAAQQALRARLTTEPDRAVQTTLRTVIRTTAP